MTYPPPATGSPGDGAPHGAGSPPGRQPGWYPPMGSRPPYPTPPRPGTHPGQRFGQAGPYGPPPGPPPGQGGPTFGTPRPPSGGRTNRRLYFAIIAVAAVGGVITFVLVMTGVFGPATASQLQENLTKALNSGDTAALAELECKPGGIDTQALPRGGTYTPRGEPDVTNHTADLRYEVRSSGRTSYVEFNAQEPQTMHRGHRGRDNWCVWWTDPTPPVGNGE